MFILRQELLRVAGQGKSSNIFQLHQLFVIVIMLVSAVLPNKILYLQRVGSGNAYMEKHKVRFICGIKIMLFTSDMIGADVGFFLKDPQLKVAPSGLMVTLCLVDGKLAVPLDLGLDKVLISQLYA